MAQAGGNVLITGNSSGLGRGFTEYYLEQGWRVYGCSRSGCDGLEGNVRDVRCDLSDFDAIGPALQSLLADAERLDLVILNAGILGEIKPLTQTPLEQLRSVMDVNVWANKVIMDWLHRWGRPIGQIVMISSGAAVLGNEGWGAYALSKASLNMLARLYSHEFPQTHISAVAPGLIDSALMDYLCVVPDPKQFPALQRIRDARGTDLMPKPREAAERVSGVLPEVKDKFTSGSFVDIREILAPEEYAELMKMRTNRK
jgi:benzil reductase ((S)-benzoin forming)